MFGKHILHVGKQMLLVLCLLASFTIRIWLLAKPPCIMCVQYHGGAQYRGVFSTVGDIMSTVGDIMSTVGGYLEYRGVFSTVGDIMINVGVFSTVGDIMSTMGVILSTVGDVQYWGYHEYRGGCSVPWGNILLFEYRGTHDIPHMYHDIPHGTQIPKDGIPTVLNTPRYS